jgi:hypothetical protein
MHDIELFAKLLELESPWRVSSVNPDFEKKEITIKLEWSKGGRVRCPFCEFEGGIYDHRRLRVWRHLDTMQFKTYLVADVPRVECPEHGVHMVCTPWASDKSRFTILRNPENWSAEEKKTFREIKGAGMKSAKAWSIRETFRGLWDYKMREVRPNFLEDGSGGRCRFPVSVPFAESPGRVLGYVQWTPPRQIRVPMIFPLLVQTSEEQSHHA